MSSILVHDHKLIIILYSEREWPQLVVKERNVPSSYCRINGRVDGTGISPSLPALPSSEVLHNWLPPMISTWINRIFTVFHKTHLKEKSLLQLFTIPRKLTGNSGGVSFLRLWDRYRSVSNHRPTWSYFFSSIRLLLFPLIYLFFLYFRPYTSFILSVLFQHIYKNIKILGFPLY